MDELSSDVPGYAWIRLEKPDSSPKLLEGWGTIQAFRLCIGGLGWCLGVLRGCRRIARDQRRLRHIRRIQRMLLGCLFPLARHSFTWTLSSQLFNHFLFYNFKFITLTIERINLRPITTSVTLPNNSFICQVLTISIRSPKAIDRHHGFTIHWGAREARYGCGNRCKQLEKGK